MPRLLPAAAFRIGSPAIRLTPHRSRRAVLGLIAEAEAASQHAAFHTRIARSSLDVPANIVDFVGTTPTTSHDFASREQHAARCPVGRRAREQAASSPDSPDSPDPDRAMPGYGQRPDPNSGGSNRNSV
ncbi:MAG: hypothetical protein KDI73_15495, partial [Candidatus Competibacteraceae bacterium]|nr:hypothetical protein [Candidatus Competibacteraceae bacterium]